MAFNRFYVISPLALVAVSACRSPFIAQSPVGGAVVKGPLNNALVFLDYNDDGILDSNEPFARTDQFGEYELFATQSNYTLIAVADDQTVDTSSGAALSGITLKAPSGAEVITPTTTLMEEGNISAEEVATVLGLPDGIDPLSFNPFDVDENDAAAVAAALEVEKVSQQIMTAVTSFASAAEGAGADEGDAFTAALGSVVEVVKAKAENIDDPTAVDADKELDFTNASDLNLIKAEATSKAAELDGIDADVMTALADDTTDAIKNVNDKIETVTDLDDDETKNIFSTMQVLKDQVKEAAETQKDGGTGTIAFKDSGSVDEAADNTAPSAITLSGDRLVSADGELVVGTVATIDPDEDDTEFTYTLAGEDAAFFDFDASSGELSLKASPNFDDKPYYEITIITKDAGGKKFSETFIIDVVPEFDSLAEPDTTVASDFETILGQNTLFKDMKDFVELQTTPDGQLVLVEIGDFADGDQSSASDGEDGPVIAFVSITERGYELRNPATNEYMGGFFTYETDDLTYTGYEVFVDDMTILAEYEDDLIKYFSPDSEYGSGKLTYSDRDIEYFALAGAKAVDKDGVTVQEMLGFNHFDENMNVLGSAGVDVADPDAPYYIEVVGEYEPGVATNITSTAIEASIAETMQILLEEAGEELLYGEDSEDGDYDDYDDYDDDNEYSEDGDYNEDGETDFIDEESDIVDDYDDDSEYSEDGDYNEDGETDFVDEESDIVDEDTPVTEDTETVADEAEEEAAAVIALPPLAPLNTEEYEVTVEDGRYLIDGVLLETLELEEGKTYRFNQSDSGNATHPLRFSETVDGEEFTESLVTFGTPGSDGAFSQISIPYKTPDLNIICQNHAGMGLILSTTTPYAGTLISDEGTDYQVELNYVTLFEDDQSSYFGELIYDMEAYPDAQFTMYWGDDDLFRVDGTDIYLKDGYYFTVYESALSISDGATIWDFPETIRLKNTDGPMHPWFASQGMEGENSFAANFTSDDFYLADDSPVLTLADFSDSAFQMGATLGTLNYGFASQYIGLKTYFDVILDDMIEIVGDELKLTSNYTYDPVDEMIKATTGEVNDDGIWVQDGIWTKGGNLNEIQFVSYETAEDLANGTNFSLLGSADVSTLFTNINPAPLTYYGSSPGGTIALSGDNKIDALLPQNDEGTASIFVTDPYYSTILDNVDDDDIIITYSFVPDGAENQFFTGAAEVEGHRPQVGVDNIYEFSDAHKTVVRTLLDEFSKVADLHFHEVTEDENEVGSMRFMWTDHYWAIEDNHAAGWASGPPGGDVYLYNEDGVPDDDFLEIGTTTGASTILHEVGHALGLNHPFEGNLFDDTTFDNQAYTVMSYSQYDDVWAWIDGESVFTISSTPSLLDITALQYYYGEQETTNLGNTTYTFEDFPFAEAIWDAGGDEDLLDFSNFTTDLTVSLVSGTSSTIPTTIPSGEWEMTDNLGIALGADIENAIGGAGNDTIVGNDLGNVINGGLGDDTLTGGDEDDIFEFFADFGDDTISDFVLDSDLLRFFDSSDTFITADAITAQDVGDDLVLVIGDNSLTLEDLAGETFGDNFLDIA